MLSQDGAFAGVDLIYPSIYSSCETKTTMTLPFIHKIYSIYKVRTDTLEWTNLTTTATLSLKFYTNQCLRILGKYIKYQFLKAEYFVKQ